MIENDTNNLPPKPKPPEFIIECGFCGYRRPESEYRHTCWNAILLPCSLIAIVCIVVWFVL